MNELFCILLVIIYKMSLEEEKLQENEWVKWLLKEDHKEELWKVLAFWEKYKAEWKQMEKKFWQKGDRKKFVNLIRDYRNNKEENREVFEESLSLEEKQILDGLNDIAKDKFYEEYLYERILYSWDESDVMWSLNIWSYGEVWDEWWIIDVKQDLQPWVSVDLERNDLWYEWTKVLAREWKDSLQPWMYIDLSDNEIWDKWIEVLAREWKHSLKPWMEMKLWYNEIWDKWAEALAREWKDSLKPGMDINLWNNEIWDKWAEALAREWKDCLKPGMGIILWNQIWDKWAEALAREWKDCLQPWMRIDLWNQIWDEWAQAIMDNWELKEWMTVNLYFNDNISDKKKKELQAWGQQYKDRWIDCSVLY